MFGADEAGRGPVLGSLFIGFVDADPATLPEGLEDSKELDAGTIAHIATELYAQDDVVTRVVEITVEDIDRQELNVTELTAKSMAKAIIETAESNSGVVDACHSDASVFEREVTSRIPEPDRNDVTVTAEHEADVTHDVVKAASIIAKYEREQHVAKLHEVHGEVGSGYPSDPRTTSFLKTHIETHGEPPACARETWSTTQELLDNVLQSDITAF